MSKRWLSVGIILVLGLVFLLSNSTVLQADDDEWDARYWNNTDLDGDYEVRRGENDLDHDWGDGSPHPDINKNEFSARWERDIDFSAGTYRFTATMDDGMRVWVDDDLIIDAWWDSQEHSISADVYLDDDEHEVKVKYYDAGGKAVARLEWAKVSGSDISGTTGNWYGEYFNNRQLSGAPVMVRNDQGINFDWGSGSPESNVLSTDSFSARWTRNASLNSGRYRFTATTDDGVRLWVNNQLIIDQWHDASGTGYTAEIDLPGGNIPIRMEYYENGGGAMARLSWTQISGQTGSSTGSITNWRGEYFSNRFLTGSPVLVRDDSQIDFNWGTSPPASNIFSDDFSVRWSRDLNLDSGRYRFTATTDDGVRVWVNNQLIIDQWYDRAVQSFSGEIQLPGGNVPVKMEYYENTSLAEAHLSWTRITGSTAPAPAPSPGTGGAYTAFVTAGKLNVRQGPSTGYGIITTTSKDTVVTLTQRNGDASWVKVILPGGTQGWVSARYLASDAKPFLFLPLDEAVPAAPAQPSSSATATVIRAFYLNVRSGPGINYGVVTIINNGQVVDLVGFRNANSSWVKVALSDGTQGWVSTYYLTSRVRYSSLAVGGW